MFNQTLNSPLLIRINRRFTNLSRKDRAFMLNEKLQIEKVLSGKAKINRSMMCKNCKIFCTMIGTIKIINKTDQLERTFMCTECGLTAHIDYIQAPTVRVLKN